MGSKSYELRKLEQECRNLIKTNDYTSLIICYKKMFELTNDYHFKQKIANIYYKVFHNIQKASEIYKEIAPHLSEESAFWWQYFEIQTTQNKAYDAVSCICGTIEKRNKNNA